MNRRTSLRLLAASAVFGLAGCLETFRDLRLRTPVDVRIRNETDEIQEILVTAYDLEDGHETYEQALSITPTERPSVENLASTDQEVRVERPADGTVESAFVSERTQSVTIRLYEDDIGIEVAERDE